MKYLILLSIPMFLVSCAGGPQISYNPLTGDFTATFDAPPAVVAPGK